MPRDGADAEVVLTAHTSAGLDLATLSAQLQSDGAKGLVSSWKELLETITSKGKVLA